METQNTVIQSPAPESETSEKQPTAIKCVTKSRKMFRQVWFGLVQMDRDESLRQLRVILPVNTTKKNNNDVLVASECIRVKGDVAPFGL